MAAKDLLMFAFVLIYVSCCVHGFPNSGINVCNITLENKSCNITHAMFSEGSVSLKITPHQDVQATMRYTIEKQCSAGEMCSREVIFGGKIGTVVHNIKPMESCILAKNKSEGQNDDSTQEPTQGGDTGKTEPTKGSGTGKTVPTNGSDTEKTVPTNGSGEVNSKDKSKRKKRDDSPDENSPPPDSPPPDSPPPDSPPQAIIQFAEDGIYMVKIEAIKLEITSEQKKGSDDKNVTDRTVMEVLVIMNNSFGYLDAADYPYLVFYSLMFVGYFFLGIVWSICMCCSCKDLIRLQLFIGVAILLGFAEKLFFVAEYGYVNNTGSRYTDSIIPLLVIAEFISAGKKTFARVLLIIISSGLGYNKLNTVNISTPFEKPLLVFLSRLFVFGGVFFTAALADGLVQTYYYTPLEGFNNTNVITAIILVILDTICLFWIVTSLIRTRRTLKENNDHRLNTYNHFCRTLMVISVGILSFLMWIFITGFLDLCSQDWRGFWLRECFWPLLFTLLLVIIMILWRPSSKTNFGKVVYTAVPQGETKEMAMKDNFEIMRMRHGSKSEGLPLNSDSEEDVIFFQ